MNWNNIVTVYLKELKDSLRDRRTLMSTIIIPTLVMPLLTFGIGKVMASGALTGNGISEDVDFDQNARQTSSFRARKESAGTAGALGSLRFG